MVIVALDESGKEKFRTTIIEIRISDSNMFEVVNSTGTVSTPCDTIDGAVISLLELLE